MRLFVFVGFAFLGASWSFASEAKGPQISEEIKDELPAGSMLLYNQKKEQSIIIVGLNKPVVCILEDFAAGRLKISGKWADRFVFGTLNSPALKRVEAIFGEWMPRYPKVSKEFYEGVKPQKVDMLSDYKLNVFEELSLVKASLQKYLTAAEVGIASVPLIGTMVLRRNFFLKPLAVFMVSSLVFQLANCFNLRDLLARRLPHHFQARFLRELSQAETGRKWMVVSRTLRNRFSKRFMEDGTDSLPKGFEVVWKKTS